MRCRRGHSLAISIMLRGQSVCVQICKPWQDISRDDKPLWHSHDFPVQTVCASKICYKFWLSCDPRWVCPDFNLSSRLQYVGGKWQILHPDCGPLICSTVFAFTHVSHVKLNFFPFQQLLSENHGSLFEAAAHLNYLQALKVAVPAYRAELCPKIDRPIEKYSCLNVYKLSVNSDATPLQIGWRKQKAADQKISGFCNKLNRK